MRPIDADALKDNLIATLAPYKRVIGIISSAPTIEAVSVVRCKECKHRTYCYGEVHMTNKRQTVNIHKDIDFCSYGEREGE